MGVAAGRLRHIVDIESVTYTQDSTTGEMTPTCAVTHSNVPCAIEPLSVKEFMQSSADQSGVSVRIVIRKRSGLSAEMRLIGVCGCHSGNIYNPMGFLEDPSSGQEWMTAPCTEGINEG